MVKQKAHDDLARLDSMQNESTMGTSYRNSYLIDEAQLYGADLVAEADDPLPLNYIVRLEETFSDADSINFILEYLPGNSLYWVMVNQYAMKLGKDESKWWIKFYASQILCALETLQRYNIVYRDVKPENMMVDSEGFLKMIDFGFAKILHP